MIIAVKGFIGSGKTTIANILKTDYDFEVIIADEIVKNMYENVSLQQEVVKTLGIEKFDKKLISKIVFSNKQKLETLENIIHPILKEKIEEIISNTKKDIVLDCQIIDKINLEYDYDIITVCSREKLIKRVMQRDGKTKEEVENILKLQEFFQLQIRKVFPIDTEQNQEQIKAKLKKIITIFKKDINRLEYEDEDEDDFYW